MNSSSNEYGFTSFEPEDNKIKEHEIPKKDDFGFVAFPEVNEQSSIEKNRAKNPFTTKNKTKEEYNKMSFLEKMQYAKDLEKEINFDATAGFSRGLISGASFSGSEQYPGFETQGEIGELIGQGIGSLAGIEFLWTKLGKPVVNLAAKSPVLKKQLMSLGRLVGWTGVGAAEQGIKNIVKGEMPNVEEMIDHGVAWGELDAIFQGLGIGGRFAKKLLGFSKEVKQPAYKIVNEISNTIKEAGVTDPEGISKIAFDILENPKQFSKKELKLPSKEITQTPIEKKSSEIFSTKQQLTRNLLNRKVDVPIFEIKVENPGLELPNPNADTLIKDLEQTPIKEAIDSFAHRAETEQSLGENIQKSISEEFKIAEKEYTPIYNEVKEIAEKIQHNPVKAIETSKKILEKINSLKTKPEGYQKVITTLNDSLHDMGYRAIENRGKFRIVNSEGKEFTPQQLDYRFPVQLSTSLELAKRLNKIIDYDILGPSIKNELKPIVNLLKQDVKSALPIEAAEKLTKADELFSKTAKRFGTEEMIGIRGEVSPEKISNIIDKPSTFERLKNSVSQEQIKQIEREILEKMHSMSYDKAKDLHRELSSKLSPEANQISNSIVESKRPVGFNEQQRKLKEAIISDLANGFTQGKRPEKTLKLWQTEKGRNAIRQTIKSNPNAKEITGYLEKQSLVDQMSKAVKDGKLDYSKFNELMKNRLFVENIRMISGEEGVLFARNLEKTTKRIENNFDLSAKILERGRKKPVKGEYERGEYLISKTKENELLRQSEIPKEVQAASSILPKNKIERKEIQQAKKKKEERGQQILKRMVEADYPLKTKIDSVLDYMGLPMQTILGLLFPYKLGVIKGVGALIGSRWIYKLISSPKARRAYSKAAIKTENPIDFMSSLLVLNDELDNLSTVE